MGANQNSSRELGLYPKFDPAPLFYLGQDRIAMKKQFTLGTRLGNLESQWKTTIDANKVMCQTMTTKIEPISNSRPHAHFTEHLVCVIEKPP
jgi:hypothetical protein